MRNVVDADVALVGTSALNSLAFCLALVNHEAKYAAANQFLFVLCVADDHYPLEVLLCARTCHFVNLLEGLVIHDPDAGVGVTPQIFLGIQEHFRFCRIHLDVQDDTLHFLPDQVLTRTICLEAALDKQSLLHVLVIGQILV